MQRFGGRRGGTTPASESCVLKLKGLPYATKEGDLREFFSDYKVLKVALVSEPDGRPSGMAFAEFDSIEESVRALTARNGDYIGDRYVKLLRVPKEEMEEQTRSGLGHGFGGLPQLLAGTGLVPPLNPAVGGAHLAMQQGQPGLQEPPAWNQGNQRLGQLGQDSNVFGGQSGAQGWDPMLGPQSFGPYGFANPNAHPNQQSGLLSGNNLGGGMGGAMRPWGNGGGGIMGNGAADQQSISLAPDNGEKPLSVLIAERQAAIRDEERRQLEERHRAAAAVAAAAAMPSYQQALGTGNGLLNPQGLPPQQQAQPGLQPMHQGLQAMQQGLHPLQANPQQMLPTLGQNATPPMAQGQAPMGFGTLQRNGNPGGYGSMINGGGMQHRSIARVNTDGSTIKIRGLPFRATPDEILGFFEGYKYLPETLHLGTDARGRPSGDGWLTFQSPDEALRCTRERNRKHLGSRYLEISVC